MHDESLIVDLTQLITLADRDGTERYNHLHRPSVSLKTFSAFRIDDLECWDLARR